MDIRYCRDGRGDSPVKKAIDQLDVKTQNKILKTLYLVGQNGLAIGPPVLEKMHGTTPSIHEIRKRYKGFIRIFCYFDGREFWLLHMIHKKSLKTPRPDLELAQDRAKQI